MDIPALAASLAFLVGLAGMCWTLVRSAERQRWAASIGFVLMLLFSAPTCATDLLQFDALSRRHSYFANLNELRVQFPGCISGGSCPVKELANEQLGVTRFAVAGQTYVGRKLGNAIDIPDTLVALTTRGAMVVASVAGPNGTPPDLWLVTSDSVSLLTRHDQIRHMP